MTGPMCPDCQGRGATRGRWCVRCAGEGVLPPPEAQFDKDAYYAAKYGDDLDAFSGVVADYDALREGRNPNPEV